MATHSSVLAWRIPGTAEPGGLPSVGSGVAQSRTRLKRLSNSSRSLGLALSSARATILTPDVPMGVAGPLPEDIVRLVLGCSSLSFQGILVMSGYAKEIKVLISPPTETVQINKG